MSAKNTTQPSSVFENKGILAGIIILAVIILAIVILFATGTLGGSGSVSPEECGSTVISYVNTHLVAGNSTATLVSVTERNGVYQVAALYQGQNLQFHATKDCSYIFSGIHAMKETPAPALSPAPTASPAPTPAPVKSARPSVELFVMAFCPYGVQAENAMGPVVSLLGTTADIQVRYIATVNGDSVDAVKSLHGLPEAEEDLRQLCIARDYPQEFWSYLKEINAQCYPVYRNATQLESCQENVTAALGMDNRKIETCASGSDGLDLLRAEQKHFQDLKVSSSPTLIMNGQKYTGQRTAEAFKQAICARFETPPAECSVDLSAVSVAASSGSC